MKVKTMRGQMLDMSALAARHETTPAVGGAQMNARGDIIGRDGQVVKPREQVAQEYHRANPKAVKHVAISDLAKEVLSPEQAYELAKQPQKKRKISDSDV